MTEQESELIKTTNLAMKAKFLRVQLHSRNHTDACELLEKTDAESLAALHIHFNKSNTSHLHQLATNAYFLSENEAIRYLRACEIPQMDIYEINVKDGERILESALSGGWLNPEFDTKPGANEDLLAIYRYIISKTSNIDRVIEGHPTALQKAVMCAYFPAVQFLLKAGADPELTYDGYNCDGLAQVGVDEYDYKAEFYRKYLALRAQQDLEFRVANRKSQVKL